MSSEILEQKQIADNRQNKLLYELIQGDFWIPWNTFQKENRPRLAKMAWVTTEEYNDSVNKYNGKTDVRNYTYNSKIREKIVAAKNAKDVLPLNDLYENMNTLSEKQKEAVMKNFSSDKEKVDMYIGNVSPQLMEKLKKLSPAALVAFLEREIQGVEEKSKEIQSRIWWEVNVEQMANISWLVDMQKRLDNFVEKYKIIGLEREKNTFEKVRKFTDSEMEQNFQKFMTSYDKAEYEKLEQKLGKNWAEESLRQMFILQIIEEKKKKGELSNEAEAEFAQMTVEFCEKVKQWGIDLAKTGLDKIYTVVLESYQGTDMYTQLSSKVLSDPEFNAYFDDKEGNKVEKLVADEKKSVEYYKNLIKLYPEMDTTNILTMFTEEYFTLTPAMQIKDSAPEEVKKTWEGFLTIANEKDETLLKYTNNIIQKSAIEQCLTALQKTMDIDIDEGKNILDDFAIDGNLDALEIQKDDLILNLKGTTNDGKGEKIDVSYNLSTGEVYYQKYMQKAGFKDTDPIVIWSSEIQDDNVVPFVKLPTLGSIVQKGKDMANDDGYLELMEKSEDSNMYETNLQDILKKEYTITENIDHELGQDMIKKNILEDSIVQKMLMIGEREFPAGAITKAQYPSMYNFYNYLYKSFEYYSLKPMVQLENWNDCIDKILSIKEQSSRLSPEELLHQEQHNKNQESFVLHGLVNQKVMGLDNTETRNQIVETNLLSFFQCFEKNVGGMAIVDVEMMNDYFRTAERNTDEGELGKWKRNSNFTRLYGDFQWLLSAQEAENDLMDQYENTTRNQYDNLV